MCYWVTLDAPPDVVVDDADVPQDVWQVYVCDGPRPPGDDTPDYRRVPAPDPDEVPVPPEPPGDDPDDPAPDPEVALRRVTLGANGPS